MGVELQYPNYPPPQSDMTPRDTATITLAIVHHGDDSPMEDPLAIDAQHRRQTWAMIGYNRIINANGTVFMGRPDDVWPAAAEGANPQSIDICLTGDFQPGTPGFEAIVPPAQIQALKDLLVDIHRQYPTINDTIAHRDVAKLAGKPEDATDCPGQVLYDLLPEIRAYVAVELSK